VKLQKRQQKLEKPTTQMLLEKWDKKGPRHFIVTLKKKAKLQKRQQKLEKPITQMLSGKWDKKVAPIHIVGGVPLALHQEAAAEIPALPPEAIGMRDLVAVIVMKMRIKNLILY
jgi:hypothetical protein